MKKRNAVLLFSVLLLSLCTSVVHAQGGKSENAETSRAPFTNASVYVEVVKTPKVMLDDPGKRESAKDASKNVQKNWLMITVSFNAVNPYSAKNRYFWYDNVDARVRILLPALMPNGSVEWAVYEGVQTLKTVKGDGQIHSIRFFVPPGTIDRYFYFGRNPAKTQEQSLRRLASELPVQVLLTYANYKVTAYQSPGKYYTEEYALGARGSAFSSLDSKKLSSGKGESLYETHKMFSVAEAAPGAFVTLKDSILSSRNTPWALLDYDKYETIKDDQGSK